MDPGWHPEGEEWGRWELSGFFAGLTTDSRQQILRKMEDLFVVSPPFRRHAHEHELANVKYSVVRPWLDPLLARAPLSVAIAGDVDPIIAEQALATWFGSLPPRDTSPAIKRPIDLPTSPHPAATSVTLAVPGKVPHSFIAVAWPTDAVYEASQRRRLNLLARVLRERMWATVREQHGDGYFINVISPTMDSKRNLAAIIAIVSVSPEKTQVIHKELMNLAKELATNGVPAEVFAQAKAQELTLATEQRQQNAWWLQEVMNRLPSQTFRIEWARTMEQDCQAITIEEVSALAKRCLVNSRALELIARCDGTLSSPLTPKEVIAP